MATILAVGTYRVQGTSMRPVLTDGDLVVANPLEHSPGRFDMLVYVPQDGAYPTIKRVIGLPGDRVRIAGGTVQVQAGGSGGWADVTSADGRTWPASPHSTSACCAPDGRVTPRPTDALVPPGAYFVLGENPPTSVDSRAHGFVPADRVRAVVVRAPVLGTQTPPPHLAPTP